MRVDLWSTFKRASAQLASTFLPLQSLAALANIIYQRKIDLQMQKQQKAISAHTTAIRNRRPTLFTALMPYTPGKHFRECLQPDLMPLHITPTDCIFCTDFTNSFIKHIISEVDLKRKF